MPLESISCCVGVDGERRTLALVCLTSEITLLPVDGMYDGIDQRSGRGKVLDINGNRSRWLQDMNRLRWNKKELVSRRKVNGDSLDL